MAGVLVLLQPSIGGPGRRRATGGKPGWKRNEVRQKILEVFGGRLTEPNAVHLTDGEYCLPTASEVSKILADSQVARMDEIKNRFDCDDFAIGLQGEVIRRSECRQAALT